MAKRKRKRDPHAHLERLAAGAGVDKDPAAADAAREMRREATAREAAVQPTAARWLMEHGLGDGEAGAVDVVAELLALPTGTSLRGRGSDELRQLAGVVERLVAAGASCPSGTPLLDVLVVEDDERDALAPSLDLDALLGGNAPAASAADRTIRLATAMMSRADDHRAGGLDLAAAVAPGGVGRHAVADELDVLLRVAADELRWPENPSPAVTVLDDGWVGASPLELFALAARRLATGAAADAVGEGLARWFDGWALGPDPWRLTLLSRAQIDADHLLHEAATRAGSDHPKVVASILTELIGMRYPAA